MYWFGEITHSDFNLYAEENWKQLSLKKRAFAQTPLEDILNLLDDLSRVNFDEALPELIKESGFSEEETRKTLELLPTLLKKENLEKRIAAEFTRKSVLDGFVKLPHGSYKTRAIPQGTILHVTAGNVFLSSIDSLIMGFVTKNLSLLKVSGQNKFFPLFFATKLKEIDKKMILADKFAVLYWKGGEEKVESFIKSKVNTIIAWGGEEMVASYKRDLPLHVKLLDFGPKISFQVVTEKGIRNKNLEKVTDNIVADIIPWNQGACASPQNLFVQDGVDINPLLVELEKAFLRAGKRGPMSEDEATEILKEKYRALYSDLMEGGKALSGNDYLIHLEGSKILRPSPLHRSLIVKRFKDHQELYETLTDFSYYLQSCSYLLGTDEKEDYLESLALAGIKRFAPLGTVTWGMEGAPHDGRFVLRELVHFIGDELRTVDFGEEGVELHDSKSLKTHFESTPHPAGFIFSSGGTTGEPKYVHFSYEEFDFMSDMLAHNLKRQGIRAGMTVANLFVAGNLWSSFLCVEKALEKIGVVQLPIGGMCSVENISTYLRKFKPQVVMGIPSMLVMFAEYMKARQEDIEVPVVFYAGEALSSVRQDYLAKVWKTKMFGSAGYASVDAGVIGYQCHDCGPGEHHVFSDLIDLKIVNDEAVVSSLARYTMPVVNYRTGDRIEWINDCSCGSSDKRFKLLGRVDNLILIWSCRMMVSDIEKVLSDNGVITFQVRVREETENGQVREKLRLSYETSGKAMDESKFLQDLYAISRDLKDTLSFHDFKINVELVAVSQGEIPRNPRTGKISLLVDERR